MYNKYYRLNESRWELPEENEYFKFPDYENDKHEIIDRYENYIEYEENNLEEKIVKELNKFYKDNKDYIVTEYDKLDEFLYYHYVDFSFLISQKIKNEYWAWIDIFDDSVYRTRMVRKVIRDHPELNPSYILFKRFKTGSYIKDLSENLFCIIREYIFNCDKYGNLYYYDNHVYCNGIQLHLSTI